MSLVALLQDGTPSGNKVDKVLAAYHSLEPEEAEAFAKLIHDPMWSGPQIAGALRAIGHDLTGDQVQNFRTKLKNGRVRM